MTHHEHHHHQFGEMDLEEDYGQRRRDHGESQPRFGRQGPSNQGEYGGWASGEGQGEFGGDGYSAQGQFSNQRVAQYRDQGYGQDYGRQGIGWQRGHYEEHRAPGQRSDWEQGHLRERGVRNERQFSDRQQHLYDSDPGAYGQHSIRSREVYGPEGRDWEQGSGGGYWGQGAGGGQGVGGHGSWDQEQSRGWSVQRGSQGHGSHGPSWQGSDVDTGFSAAGSWMAGPHSGRGPQGYRRSDARIEEDICEHLTHHGMLDATGIQVHVENGEVTLTGTVESRQAKRLAEDILDSISGVQDIHNQLRVQRGGPQDHQNPIMAEGQMNQSDARGSNGQSRTQSQRGEKANAGAGNS